MTNAAATLNRANDRMIAELADAAMLRFYSAKREGLTEHEAFEEIIRTVLKTYRDAIAS